MAQDYGGTVVEPRLASTVVAVRDGASGVEAWMMRRAQTMAFAPGALVFPGGRVDSTDGDPSVPWSGGSVQQFADRLGTRTEVARSVVTAAVRELFEEAGALLASPSTTGDLDELRLRVEQRDLSLAGLVDLLGVELDVSPLVPWMRWVTPETETRRYDTFFFIAELPAGVTTGVVNAEGDTGGWEPASHVLQAHQDGRCLLMPPTEAVLRGLVRGGSTQAVLAEAASRPLAAIAPVVSVNGNGDYVVEAGGETFVRRGHSS